MNAETWIQESFGDHNIGKEHKKLPGLSFSFASVDPNVPGSWPQVADKPQSAETDEESLYFLQSSRDDITPHMSHPLPDDSTPLDFSPILDEIGKVNADTAAPLAGLWMQLPDENERALINILAQEFDNSGQKQKSSFWSTAKRLSVGLSEEEYHEHYPWAKFTDSLGSHSVDENS